MSDKLSNKTEILNVFFTYSTKSILRFPLFNCLFKGT